MVRSARTPRPADRKLSFLFSRKLGLCPPLRGGGGEQMGHNTKITFLGFFMSRPPQLEDWLRSCAEICRKSLPIPQPGPLLFKALKCLNYRPIHRVAHTLSTLEIVFLFQYSKFLDLTLPLPKVDSLINPITHTCLVFAGRAP